MSKIKYPSEGIYYISRDLIDKSKTCLNANLNVSFDVPSDFSYRSYILKLNTISSNFYKELVSIEKAIYDSNRRFSNLSEDLSNSINKMVVTKIDARERMIK